MINQIKGHKRFLPKIMEARSLLMILFAMILCPPASAQPTSFFEKYCYECHDASAKRGGLDLSSLKLELANPENFARWLKIHDQI